jgi:uncharacterized membrane protein YbhN (UPF0104 family)
MQRGFEKIKALTEHRWLRYGLVALGVGFTFFTVASIMYRNWTEFQTFSWQLKPLPLIGAALALVAAFGLNVITWVLICRVFGSHVGFWKDMEIYSFSTIVRRLPGAIWQLASRTYLYHQENATLAIPLWGSFWEVVTQIVSGMLLAALMLLLSPDLQSELPGGMWWLLALIPSVWLIVRPQDIMSLARAVSPRIKSQPSLTARSAAMWLGLYLVSWILGGAILYFLISSLAPQSLTLLPVCVGLVAVSGVLAILASPIPGGLGIREVSVILLLGLYVPSPLAVAGGLLLRLWLIIGEAVIALFVFVAARRRHWWAQMEHNTP